MPIITCHVTNQTADVGLTKAGEPRIPNGWKRFGDQYVSPEGQRRAYVCRGLTVPVGQVVVHGQEWTEENFRAGWTEFRRCLAISWRQCAQVANWWIAEVAKADNRPILRNGNKVKLPKLVYDQKALNALCRQTFPDLDSQSVYAVARLAVRRYEADRWAIRVECSKSLPSVRHPAPLPIRVEDSPMLTPLDPDGSIVFRLRIAGTRFSVRLKNTANFERQLISIRRAALGEIPRGAISLRDHDGQVLLTLAAWLPKDPGPREVTETFLVRTDPNALLVGEMAGRNVFVMNEDELARWHKAHLCYLQRMRQDLKAERRIERQARRNMLRALDRRCAKHARRVQDRLHKVASIVANHAKRRRVAAIVYDDEHHDYLPTFPWYRLKGLITEKCDAFGIEVVSQASPGAEAEKPKKRRKAKAS